MNPLTHRLTNSRRAAGWVFAALTLCLADQLSAQGFKLQQGYLEPVIARAGRVSQITTVLQYTNTALLNSLSVELVPPAGGTTTGSTTSLVWSVAS